MYVRSFVRSLARSLYSFIATNFLNIRQFRRIICLYNETVKCVFRTSFNRLLFLSSTAAFVFMDAIKNKKDGWVDGG